MSTQASAGGARPLDNVKIQVVAPPVSGTGLDVALERLQAIEARILAINRILSKPVEIRTQFKRISQAQDALKEAMGQLEKSMGGARAPLTPENIAKAFGWDASDFKTYVARVGKEIQQQVRNLTGIKHAPGLYKTTGEFTRGNVAAAAVRMFHNELARHNSMNLSDLMGKFIPQVLATGGAVREPVPKGMRVVRHTVNAEKTGWSVQEVTGDERGNEAYGAKVRSNVPTKKEAEALREELNDTLKAKGWYRSLEEGLALAKRAQEPPAPAKPAPHSKPASPPPGGARLVETKRVIPAREEQPITQTQKYVAGLDRTVSRITRHYRSGEAAGSSEAVAEIERVTGLGALRDELARTKAGFRSREGSWGRTTQGLRQGLEELEQFAHALQEFSARARAGGFFALAQRAEADAARVQRGITRLRETVSQQAEAERIELEQRRRVLAQRGAVRQRLMSGLVAGEQLTGKHTDTKARAVRYVTEQMEGEQRVQRTYVLDRSGGSLHERRLDARKELAREAALQEKEFDHQLARTRSAIEQQVAREQARSLKVRQIREVRDAYQSELASGGRLKWQRRDTDGGFTRVLTRDLGGGRARESTYHWDRAGASLKEVTRNIDATRKGLSYLGKDFLTNTRTVTAWAASVKAYQAVLGVAGHAGAAAVQIQANTARLGQVFRGTREEAQGLADEVIELGARYGRGSKEAMESAIAWARLGLSRAETAEAVRVSMEAANVAELTSAEATRKLSGVMLAYQLQVKDLNGVLGELNAISNTYSVRNADLLDGLSRSAAIAKQAGLGFSELIGILGSVAAATGQSGANIGNAVKSVVVALSNPALQEVLRKQYRFEVRTNEGSIKHMGQLLDELFVKYATLNSLERQAMVEQVAGKTQASRMQSMLDNYTTSLRLAINAQLNLGSAAAENKAIMATLQAQTAGLVTEFERFSATQARGPLVLLTELARAMRGLMAVMNALGMRTAVTTVGALLGVMSARAMITGMRLSQADHGVGVGKSSFLLSTGMKVRQAFADFTTTLEASIQEFQDQKVGAGLLGPRIRGRATHLGRGLDWLKDRQRRSLAVSRWYRLDAARAQRVLDFDANTGVADASGVIALPSLGPRIHALGRLVRAGAFAPATAALGRLLLVSRACLVAVRSLLVTMAVPALALTAAFWAFNWAIEKLGLTSEETRKRVAGLNEEAEVAASKARAAAMSVRLLDVSYKALQNRDVNAARILSDLESLQTLTTQGRAELRAAGQDRMKILTAVDEERKRQVIQAQDAAKLAQDKRVAQVRELEQRRRELEERSRNAREQDIALGAAPEGVGASISSLFNTSEEQAKLERDRVKLTEEIAEGYEAMAQQSDQVLAHDLEHLSALERQKTLVDGMVELIKELPAASAMDRVMNDIVGASLALAALERQASTLQAGLADPRTSGAQKLSMEGRYRSLLESQRELGVRMAGQWQRLALAQRQDSMDTVLKRASGELSRYDVGGSQTERLLSRREGIERCIVEQRRAAAQAADNSLERQAAELRLLEASAQKMRNLLDIDQQRFDLERERHQLVIDANREWQKSLLTAGPAELLRKLAAMRAVHSGGGRISAGQFFAADPAMREQFQLLGQFNPDLLENARNRRLLGPAPSDKALSNQVASLGIERQMLAWQFGRTFAGTREMQRLQDTAAVAELGRLANGASAAAEAVAQLESALRRVLGATKERPGGQFGGLGAQTKPG